MKRRLTMQALLPGVALTAALLAPVLPAAAQQPTWRPGSSGGDAGDQAWIDTSSITREGDKVRFLREIRVAQPRQLDGGRTYDRFGGTMEVDCRARTIRSIELYAKLGSETIARGPSRGIVDPVRPGSAADIDLRAVCFNEWPPQP